METIAANDELNPSSIVLTGFMGTGKTAVGRILANETGREFVDTDELIVHRTGLSIVRLFRERGEEDFRRLETELIREYAGKRDLVIATGGRLMLNPLNALLVHGRAAIFCLVASPEEILARVKNDPRRRPLLEVDDPLLTIRKLLDQRQEGYNQFIQFNTEGKKPQQVATDLLRQLGEMVEKQQWQTPLTSRVEVRHPLGSYDVVVGRGLLPRSAYISGKSSRTAVVTDSNVTELYVKNLNDIDLLVEIVTPAGEEHKTLETVREIYNQLLEVGLDRRGTILALGGGVVGDMAGFVAATYMRGIRFIQCPTSLLAMVDASVGGKTGVDLPQGKNLVGAFKQPEAVIADLDTLRTLPIVELRSGMAEVVKSGLIASRGLLDSVTALARSIGSIPGDNTTSLPIDDLHPLIVEAIMIKRDIVESDPFERDERRLLNLGHTFGHAIELTSGYAIRHGEAVAIGLVAASRLSSVLGYCGSELSEQIEGVLTDLRLPTRIPEFLEIDQIMLAMKTDKKSDSGSVHFILIRDVGDVFVKTAVPLSVVKQVLESLKTE